jgi:N-acetyl sugar amidotransferase
MFEVCKRCLMPNTRPDTPFSDDVCQACKNFDTRGNVNWEERLRELREICERHKKKDGSWDCVIPVSGGKDSHAMVYWIKEVMGMNPLLITAGDPFTKTQAGKENYFNLGEAFNCDQLLGTVSPDLARRLIKAGFEEFLDPLRFIEQVLNTIPFKLGSKLGVSLSFKGESPFIYGASVTEDKSALERILKRTIGYSIDYWVERGAKKEELNFIMPLDEEELSKLNPECYYLSYFVPWSSLSSLKVAKRYGFVDLSHEWRREGCMEDFEQIDSMAYLTHLWLKYPKFGFQRTTDIAARRIREGALSIDEAKKLILQFDLKLDQLAMKDFNDFLGFTTKEFWDVVDKFWDPEIFEKDGVAWRMKVDRFPHD